MRMQDQIDAIILAKGHAAAGQYAVMYNTGAVTHEQLYNYKRGREGDLEAHADLLCDTGSLGQSLSCVAGMAAESPNKNFAVILGDGELQEGQNYEALMTINFKKLRNITICIDRNGFQSDNECNQIMPIHNLELVLQGFGFDVSIVDGHDPDMVLTALESTLDTSKPHRIIIFNTIKGGIHMEPSIHPDTNMLCQPWHTKIPDWNLYITIIDEKLNQILHQNQIKLMWEDHKKHHFPNSQSINLLPNSHRPSLEGKGTGKAFGNYLSEIILKGNDNNRLRVVSCDLATSCGLNTLVGHKQFFELGVSEQDAASFCGGLTLEGKRQHRVVIPVFATYSNFLKRCFENIFINSISGAHCIYFGTYSGLCYHTDGKSHQSFADVRSFSGLPNMIICDPISESHAKQMLDYILSQKELTCSYYFRLRRTPMPRLREYYQSSPAFDLSNCFQPQRWKIDFNEFDASVRNVVIVAMGTISTQLALQCVDAWNSKRDSSKPTPAKKAKTSSTSTSSSSSSAEYNLNVREIICVSVVGNGTELSLENYAGLDGTEIFITIEDDVGVLRNLVTDAVAHIFLPYAFGAGRRDGRHSEISHTVVSKTMTQHGPSFRTLEHCLQHHGYTVAGIEALL